MSHTPQDFLDRLFLLRAGFLSPAELSDWAADLIAAASPSEVPNLTDLVLACTTALSPQQDAGAILERLGQEADGNRALAVVADRYRQQVEAGVLPPDEAIHRIEAFIGTRFELLTAEQHRFLNEASFNINTWPQSDYPWAEIIGRLVPAALLSLSRPAHVPA